MKKNILKLIPILAILLALSASVIWTYQSTDTKTETISYISDIIIIIMLFVILIYSIFFSNKTKSPIKQQNNYQEWITEGSVDINNRLNINIFSLEDLVKLAMDLDKRVIHDPKLDKYYAFADDIVYIYDPAFVSLMMDNKQQIGKLLLERGLIRPEQLEIGLYYQKRIGTRLGDSLIALGFIDETTLYSTLAAQQKIAYYELDPKIDITETEWLATMSINKARALQILPVGRREDGKLVIACGESAMTGIATALQEMFGNEIYIVAARPSHIFEILERIEQQVQEEKEKNSFAELARQRKIEPYDRLTEGEWLQFTNSYSRGRFDTELFIKATGLVNPVLFSQVPDKDTVTSWLTGKSLIGGEYLNLINALGKIIKRQDPEERQKRVVPQLSELLKEAFYITPEAEEWVIKEAANRKKTINLLLESNYLVAGQTVTNAVFILDTFKKIINKAKIY